MPQNLILQISLASTNIPLMDGYVVDAEILNAEIEHEVYSLRIDWTYRCSIVYNKNLQTIMLEINRAVKNKR